jgi:hypothetical protein
LVLPRYVQATLGLTLNLRSPARDRQGSNLAPPLSHKSLDLNNSRFITHASVLNLEFHFTRGSSNRILAFEVNDRVG